MPAALLAVPAAAALAWWLLRGGPLRRRPRAGAPPGDVDGALERGDTQRLAAGQEEEEFRREDLPYERLSTTGGEYGGVYGPQSGPGGDGSSSEAPAATQTTLSTTARALHQRPEPVLQAAAVGAQQPAPTYVPLAPPKASAPAPTLSKPTGFVPF